MGNTFRRNWKKSTGKGAVAGSQQTDLALISDVGAIASGVVVAPSSNSFAVTVAGSGTAETPNPDFATLSDALNAGHRVIKVIGDTVEVSTGSRLTITSTSGVSIEYLNGAETNFQANQLEFSSCPFVSIYGNGKLRGAATEVLLSFAASTDAKLDGITIENAGGTAAQAIQATGGSNIIANGITILCRRPIIVTGSEVNLIGCKIDGTNIDQGVLVTGGGLAKVSNSVFSGTYTTDDFSLGGCFENDGSKIEIYNCRLETTSSDAYLVMGTRSIIDGLTIEPLSPSTKLTLTNTFNSGPQKASEILVSNVNVGAISQVGGVNNGEGFEYSTFNNVVASGEGMTICDDDSQNNTFVNCRFGTRNAVGEIRAIGLNNKYSNCFFYGGLHVGGSGNSFTGCELIGSGVSVHPTTENNTMVGCHFAQDVHFLGGSSGNIISSSIVDGQIYSIGNNLSIGNIELNL